MASTAGTASSARRSRSAPGLAFKHQYAKDGGTCLAYFGDGAANQGQVYESFNMAKLWDLPVIYAIENNQYAMGTSVERSASEPDFYKRGESFRIPGIQVDGMDVLAVRGAAEEAMAWTQAGKGPIILELKTYRYRGHSMSDPAKYRTPRGSAELPRGQGPDRPCRQGTGKHGRRRGRAEGDRQGNQGYRRRCCQIC